MLGGMLAYLAIVAMAAQWFPLGQVLRKLRVPALEPEFADLRNVLSAMECQRRGFDVLIQNPCDPLGRPMNYPRLWLWPGLDQSWTVPIGIGMGALFLGALLWSLRGLDRRAAAIALCIVLSLAIVLVVERGNVDEMVFAGVVAAASLVSLPRLSSRASGYILLAILGMAKLFPFAAFAVAIRERRPWATAIITAATATAAAYALATWRDLQEIAQAVPRPITLAYGIKVLPLQIVKSAGDRGIAIDPRIAVIAGYLGFALLAVGAAVFANRVRRCGVGSLFRAGGEVEIGFIACSAIYLFNFVAMQNFIYRLIFLLPALPQFVVWRRSPGPLRSLGTAAILALIVAVWAVPFMTFVYGHVFGRMRP